jgi:transposase
MTTLQDQQKAIELIDNACFAGARLPAACDILGVSPRTVQRWRRQEKPDGRKAAAQQRTPANKLSDRERDQILTICNQPEFANMSPNQIVPALADQGIYVASESSFYRVLRKAELAHRGTWRVLSVVSEDPYPAYSSMVVTFQTNSKMTTIMVLKDRSTTTIVESYRVVDDVLVISGKDYVVNGKYSIEGKQMIFVAPEIRTVLEEIEEQV